MTITTTQAVYEATVSEESLKEILEYYWKHKYTQDINISNVVHKTGHTTEGFGINERDYDYPDGLQIKFKEK